MKKYLLAIMGALGALFYALSKSKDRKIEKLQQENQSHKQKSEEKEFIANEQIKTQIKQTSARDLHDDDVYRVFDEHGWIGKD